MPKIINTVEEFDDAIKGDKVVVDFFATWCMPCRKMGEVVETVEPEYKDVDFIKVDVDKLPEIAQRYGVYSIPQLNFISKSEDKGKIVGFHYEKDFRDLLDKAFKA